jgi:hypothetical protein
MGWSSIDLRNDLKELKKIYNLEKDMQKKEKILSNINTLILTICDIELGEDSYTDINDWKLLFCSVPRFSMYYPAVYKFINTLNASDVECFDNIIPEGNKKEIDSNDIFPMMHDFYKSVGKEIFNHFLTIDKDHDRYINFDKEIESSEGVTYYVPILNKRYYTIGSAGDNREILATLTHEYGHSIASIINPNRYFNNDFFIEIESIFFEIIGLDYYYNITKDKYYSDLIVDKTNTYYWNANNVVAMKRISDKTFMNMKDEISSIKLLKKYLNQEGFDENCITVDVDDKMKYLFSYIVAIELFEIYKEDKNLAIDLLKKMINRDKEISEYESIHTNVTPVKSLNKHLNRIMRY